MVVNEILRQRSGCDQPTQLEQMRNVVSRLHAALNDGSGVGTSAWFVAVNNLLDELQRVFRG